MNRVYLSLGSNLGNKSVHLLHAIGFIAERIGIFSAISSVYETKPWGFESGNDFLNMAVCVETHLPPEEILTITQSIERSIGRSRKTDHSYHDRVIDIDLIAYDDIILQTKSLQLPHPLFHKRQFVLDPFNEIAPDYVHPVFQLKVRELLAFFCIFATSKTNENMINKINALLAEINELKIQHSDEIEALRIKYLSKKGEIASLMNGFRMVASEEKRSIGQKLNELKEKAQDKINELKASIENQNASAEQIDITRTAYPYRVGTRHPLSIVRKEICDIFGRLGFSIVEGPEIEDDWHVFSSLNFADDHPARDMQDTFFIRQGVDLLLRTHTSSVQTRAMEKTQPPIRIICPGRVYRNEAISYRAHCFFHQVEALYVDKNVSFADLRQVLLFFAKEMFGSDTKIRLRPSFFPFTEPSAEMDISCNLCGGKGCPFCKHTGWVEILGCGMVDPNVLDNCGIDSKIYSGYALGMGIERITNLKYQVKDLRLFSENDIRFLRQFEAAN